MEVGILTTEGNTSGTHSLPEDVFAEPLNHDLLHQVVSSLQKRKQQPVAHTKDRSERRGGGKKPWRQKGTGRARHGSRRSPIWRKGGVTFGPTNARNFNAVVPKKMKRKAMRMVLSDLVTQEELYLINTLQFSDISTKEAKRLLQTILGERFTTYTLTVVPSEWDTNMYKSMRNLSNVSVIPAHSLSLENILESDLVLTNPDVVDILAKKYRD